MGVLPIEDRVQIPTLKMQTPPTPEMEFRESLRLQDWKENPLVVAREGFLYVYCWTDQPFLCGGGMDPLSSSLAPCLRGVACCHFL